MTTPNQVLATRLLPVMNAAAYSCTVAAQEVVEEVIVIAQKRKEKLQNVKQVSSHIDFGGYYRVAGWTEPRTVGVSFNQTW